LPGHVVDLLTSCIEQFKLNSRNKIQNALVMMTMMLLMMNVCRSQSDL